MTSTAETEVAAAVPATEAPAPPAAPAPSPESGPDTGGSSPRPAAGPRSRLSVRQVRPDSLSGDDLSADVAFLIRLKGARGAAVDADELSTLAPSESSALTDADTDATLVDERGPQLEQQVAALERELLQQRRKVARLERRNRELLEREAGAAAQGPAGEPERVRLLHTIHRLTAQTDDLQDEKRALEQRVQELSAAAQQRSPGLSAERQITDLRMRLSKAESLAEDLQEENDELRHQITEMENEMEEIQDSFCEDQVEEYQDLKKQLEQANKNGRVIQFKLRKAERSLEEAQQEKESLEKQLKEFRESGGVCRDQVERLKTELKLAKEVSVKLGDEVEQLRSKDKTTGGRPPMRRQPSASNEGRLLRELQDALEREADLREQMRFAEQDAAGLRRKLVRVEEENDGLTAQLRKLASKNRRRSSRDRALDGDEGIAEDMEELTPHELRIQLELNEMETATLRRKIEKIEEENETLRIQVAELQQKPSSPKLRKLDSAANINDPNAYYEHRINVLEDEMNEVRKKLIEREREIDVLKTEMQMNHKRGRGPFARARSLDLPDTASLGRMRQVQSCSPEHDTVERPPAEPAGGPEHGAAPHGGAEPEQGSGGTGGVRETALHSGVPPSAALQELEMELKSQKQSFEELARKHEILEENYAELKAQSSLERDQLDGEFTVLKHEYDAVQSELRSLREAHSSQQDQWLREKLNLEQRAKEAEKRWGVRAEETSWKLEKMRLQESLREKNEEIDKLEKSKLSQKQDIEDIRKDMERQLVTARAAGSRALEQEKLQLQQELASSQLTTDQLQQDLLELRAAHAKLREAHRRVLRERDGCERERAELVGRHHQLLRAAERQESSVTHIAGQIDKVSELVPLVIKGSRLTGQREKDHAQLQQTVAALAEGARQLRDGLQVLDDARERCPPARRPRSYQRSASAGASPAGGGAPTEPGYRSPYPSLPGSPPRPPSGQLARRAASMGLRGSSQDSVYHRDEGSVESLGPFHYQTLPRIKLNDDPNFDRVSTESTQSEIVNGAAAVKKKGALRGLFRGWSRSKSVDTMGSSSDLETSPPADSEPGSSSPPTEAPPANEPAHTSIAVKTEPGPKIKKKIGKLFRTASPANTRKHEDVLDPTARQQKKEEPAVGRRSPAKAEARGRSGTATEPQTEPGSAAESPVRRTEPAAAPAPGPDTAPTAAPTTTAVPATAPFRNPPVAVRTPLSLSPAPARSVSVGRPTTTFSSSLLASSAARRAARRAAPPAVALRPSPVQRAPLIFNSFSRARARFES